MITVCAYCKRVIKPEDGVNPGAVSHGICAACAAVLDAQIDAWIALTGARHVPLIEYKP